MHTRAPHASSRWPSASGSRIAFSTAPAELSGGEQQRVAIARALASDPSILLADEPTGNLDTATSKQIMDLLAELNGQGKTILMVTHEPDLATYASHRLHMQDGVIDRIEETAA